jgi:glycosyltransferase involved in cell wall biosynthesis
LIILDIPSASFSGLFIGTSNPNFPLSSISLGPLRQSVETICFFNDSASINIVGSPSQSEESTTATAFFISGNGFVLSSDWEGLPTILIEALSLKKQIVSTDCLSGPREILDNGKFGLLVPMNNPEKLAEGMSKIINGEVKFDEGLLLQRAKYFSIEKSFNQFMEIIH